MGKYIRGFYLGICYILGLPLLVLMFVIWSVLALASMWRDNGYELQDIKDWFMAGFEGLRSGHKINMYYVKHGTKEPIDLDELAKDLS